MQRHAADLIQRNWNRMLGVSAFYAWRDEFMAPLEGKKDDAHAHWWARVSKRVFQGWKVFVQRRRDEAAVHKPWQGRERWREAGQRRAADVRDAGRAHNRTAAEHASR